MAGKARVSRQAWLEAGGGGGSQVKPLGSRESHLRGKGRGRCCILRALVVRLKVRCCVELRGQWWGRSGMFGLDISDMEQLRVTAWPLSQPWEPGGEKELIAFWDRDWAASERLGGAPGYFIPFYSC